MNRWFRFIVSIIIGIGVGLAGGWILGSQETSNATLDSLRIDYKTDYVLMVAESFQKESNIQLAIDRVSLLGRVPLLDQIQEAINFAEKVGYNEPDIAQMLSLQNAIQVYLSK